MGGRQDSCSITLDTPTSTLQPLTPAWSLSHPRATLGCSLQPTALSSGPCPLLLESHPHPVAVASAAAHLSSGMSTTARLTRSLPSLHVFPWLPAPHRSQHLR